jgi:hypothetical protein
MTCLGQRAGMSPECLFTGADAAAAFAPSEPSEAVRLWMPRLVQHDVVCARHLQHQGHTEGTLLGCSAEGGAPALEISPCGPDVIAHQRDRVMSRVLIGDALVRLTGGMNAKLARPAPKDEPSRCRLLVDERPPQHVPEKRAVPGRRRLKRCGFRLRLRCL